MSYATTGYYRDNSAQTYRTYYDQMARVCPGKMLALCEGEAMPSPQKMQANDPAFPRWLYTISWWAGSETSWNCTTTPCNPCDWLNTCYNHDFVVTLDDLPDLQSPETTAQPAVRARLQKTMVISPHARFDIRGRSVRGSSPGEILIQTKDWPNRRFGTVHPLQR
jgi:hypothetical protein